MKGANLLRRILTFALLSLSCCLFAILATVRQINRDEALGYDNAGISKLPSLKISQEYVVKYQGIRSRIHSELSHEEQARSSLGGKFDPRASRLPFSCREIRNITIISELGHGYTKTVQKGLYQGMEVAVKSTQALNKDITICRKHGEKSEKECFNLAKYKLAKEILLLQQLRHPNIVKVRQFELILSDRALEQQILDDNCPCNFSRRSADGSGLFNISLEFLYIIQLSLWTTCSQ